jgi:predicted AAA+ superfamily ATPase
MDDSLAITLRTHNPWLENPGQQSSILLRERPVPYIRRAAELRLEAGSVALVVGPRQAGKSTWIRQELASQPDPVLVLHAEEPRIRQLCQSPAEALHALQGVLTDPTILFFEEVQHLADAPLFLKGLVDLQPKRRLVATGSSSLQLRARTRESLAGRARRTLLLPFSLSEVGADVAPDLLPAMREDKLNGLWERLALEGGYPKAWLEPKAAESLHRLVEAFVLKDVSDLHTVDRPAVFRKLLELAAADIGNLVNVSAWAAQAGASRPTAARYLDIAEQAHVLRLVPPFSGGKRAEITAAPKVYFVDCGLRNAVFGGFYPFATRPDRGALWENAVFAELLKQTALLDRICHWRTKSQGEVDFVVQRSGALIGIEVKAAPLVRPKLGRAAHSFIDAYRPDRFVLINSALRHDDELGGVPILYRRPFELAECL